MKEWSTAWQKSKNPQKQRKFRAKAPKHQRGRFVSARLKDSLREKLGTKSIPVRAGDKVEIMRGDYTGKRGTVDRIDREEYRLYVEGVKRETVSGSETMVSVDPSNVMLMRLDLDDDMRAEQYDLSAAEKEEIQVRDESSEEDTDQEDEEPASESESSDESVDYEDIVSGTIDEVKTSTDRDDVDFEKVLAAERENKDRKTLVEWLEKQVNDDE